MELRLDVDLKPSLKFMFKEESGVGGLGGTENSVLGVGITLFIIS